MNELAVATARGLWRWVVKLGRWVLEHLAQRAGWEAVGYFRGRARDFERRREQLLPQIVAAKGNRKLRRGLVMQHQLLQVRRRVWNAFARWLAAHVEEVTEAAVRVYCLADAKALERLPMLSDEERKCRDAA